MTNAGAVSIEPSPIDHGHLLTNLLSWGRKMSPESEHEQLSRSQLESKPRQQKRGRLTKATPERIEAILADIANGLTKEQACACNGVSATSFRKWEERPEFPDLRAKAQGLRIKALLAKQEAAAQAGDQWRWKHYTWSLEKVYRNQYGDSAALVLYEQNNYQLSEEREREIQARIERLMLENGNGNLQ